MKRQAAMEEAEDRIPGMDLSLPMTIAELIAIRAQIIQSWRDCNAAIDAIDAAFARIRDKDFQFMNYDRGGQRWEKRQDKVEINAMTEILDYSLFVFALEKLNITNAMTEMAKTDFLAKLKGKKTVFCEKELTGLAQNADSLFRDSSMNTVRDVFRRLIGSGYHAPAAECIVKKKDNLQKVERVFRVGWSDVHLSSSWTGSSLAVRHWHESSSHFRFNDLLSACRLIDGEGIPNYSNNLHNLIQSAPKGDTVDTGYFVLQAYKNGNVKVRWNEDKIHVLEKLNAIGSGRESAMPDSQRKRYKSSHFHDGGAPKAETFFNPEGIEPSDEKDFAFYPTPPPVARRMVELAEFPAEDISFCLEPSAGDGAILREMVRANRAESACWAVEFNHHRALKLKAEFPIAHVTEADFLRWESEGGFKAILMNPPFNDRVEAYHVVKAFSLLKPTGILVAILPEGWFTRDDQKSTVLRAFLQEYEHKPSEKLPPGTFSRTRIATRIIILKKKEIAEEAK